MFKARSFGCGSLILVFLATIGIVAIGGYYAFNVYISPYLNNVQVQELYMIYSELSEQVNEQELVTNSPEEADYTNAQSKLSTGGINIFNEYGDIDPTLLEEANILPASDITLTDKEFASVINEFIANPLNLTKIGINEEEIGGLNTEILEVKIETANSINVNLSFIVKLDMQDIKQQLSFFGFFIPDYLYIENQNTIELVNGEYQLVSGNINVNNLDEEKNQRVFEILVDALEANNPEMTVESLRQSMGLLILSGVKEVSNTFNTNITFNNGAITFSPQA